MIKKTYLTIITSAISIVSVIFSGVLFVMLQKNQVEMEENLKRAIRTTCLIESPVLSAVPAAPAAPAPPAPPPPKKPALPVSLALGSTSSGPKSSNNKTLKSTLDYAPPQFHMTQSTLINALDLMKSKKKKKKIGMPTEGKSNGAKEKKGEQEVTVKEGQKPEQKKEETPMGSTAANASEVTQSIGNNSRRTRSGTIICES